MDPKLRALVTGKADLCADKLPSEFDHAFLGWSMYQPHHYLPSPVYDIDKMYTTVSRTTLSFEEFVEYLYDVYVRGKKKTFAPVFVSSAALGKEITCPSVPSTSTD